MQLSLTNAYIPWLAVTQKFNSTSRKLVLLSGWVLLSESEKKPWVCWLFEQTMSCKSLGCESCKLRAHKTWFPLGRRRSPWRLASFNWLNLLLVTRFSNFKWPDLKSWFTELTGWIHVILSHNLWSIDHSYWNPTIN